GLGARGAAFLGDHRRAHVGGEAAVYTQPISSKRRYFLLAGHVAATADYALPLGRARRFELAFGAMLGVVYESLQSRRDVSLLDTTIECPARQRGEVSRRGGLIAGARIGLLFLLGRRRNHELGLRVGPALVVSGPSSRGDDTTNPNCQGQDHRPFE